MKVFLPLIGPINNSLGDSYSYAGKLNDTYFLVKIKMQMFLFIFKKFSKSKEFTTQTALNSFLTVKHQTVFLIRQVERTKDPM